VKVDDPAGVVDVEVEADVLGVVAEVSGVDVETGAVVADCVPVCDAGEMHPISTYTVSGIAGTGVCLLLALATWTS
jgi:hypothetical protein